MAAPKRPSEAAEKSAADVIAQEMPEWKLAEPDEVVDVTWDENAMKTDQGLSIAKLRRKFGVADAAADESPFADVDTSVKTVRIEPKAGGPAKTADIKQGKVTIVQG